MKRLTINADTLKTICWLDDKIVDWARAGTLYSLDGQTEQINKYHFAFSFDSALTSHNGKYAFIYKRLGTKGLLLKDGEIIREINRSYYHAEDYEYPAAFAELSDGRTILIHCPFDYCRLDFEEVETGKILTNSTKRSPQDIFHSRLEISPDNKFFINKGWVWHPWDIVEFYDIKACLDNPELLDRGNSIPNNSSEICSASFIDNDRILVCSSMEEPMDEDYKDAVPPGHLAIWDFKKNLVSKAVKVKSEFGNLFAIDDKFCWDLYRFPKIINIETGEVIEKVEEISSSLQNSSIFPNGANNSPLIAYNRELKKLAITNNETIEFLWKEP